jgi:hypothetical protein
MRRTKLALSHDGQTGTLVRWLSYEPRRDAARSSVRAEELSRRSETPRTPPCASEQAGPPVVFREHVLTGYRARLQCYNLVILLDI